MNWKREFSIITGSAILLVVVAFMVLSNRPPRNYEAARMRSYAQAAQWPDLTQEQARAMIERYGPPDSMTDQKMEWDRRWPWKRIVVDASYPLSPLTQTVACHIPDDKVADLARFPHGLIADAYRGELSARSDREPLNRLSLNLGMDIMTGQRSPEDASRYFYHAIDLYYAGKSVSYMDRLVFDVPKPIRRSRVQLWTGGKY